MKNLKLVVYQNKTKANQKNEAPVYIRIIVGETRKEFSLGFKVNIDRWNDTDGLTRRNAKLTETEKKQRNQIDEKLSKFQKYAEMKDNESEPYTAEMVFNQSENPNPHKNISLLQVIDLHKLEYDHKVIRGKVKENSYKHFKEMKRFLIEFLNKEKNLSDLPVALVNDEFQLEFHSYMSGRMVKNSANKMIVYFRCIMTFAKTKGYIKKDLDKYDLDFDKVKKVALTIKELQKIIEFVPDRESLEITKDIFLFNVVTGYAWTDLSKLTYDDIKESQDGYYIDTDRNKTGETEQVPLTDDAIQLINKYRLHPECLNSNKLFPFKHIATMIGHLKTIAEKVGIEKNLSTKIARNTFVTLGFNLGMNVKILSVTTGHSNIKQTEEYGSTYLSSQFQEMKKLEGVLKMNPKPETIESKLKVA